MKSKIMLMFASLLFCITAFAQSNYQPFNNPVDQAIINDLFNTQKSPVVVVINYSQPNYQSVAIVDNYKSYPSLYQVSLYNEASNNFYIKSESSYSPLTYNTKLYKLSNKVIDYESLPDIPYRSVVYIQHE